jgi:hypothetical protein
MASYYAGAASGNGILSYQGQQYPWLTMLRDPFTLPVRLEMIVTLTGSSLIVNNVTF